MSEVREEGEGAQRWTSAVGDPGRVSKIGKPRNVEEPAKLFSEQRGEGDRKGGPLDR